MIAKAQNGMYVKTVTAACQPTTDWLELDFYTKSHSLKGQISCPAGIRVLDMLNTPCTIPNGKTEFLELKDYESQCDDGSPTTVCVKKENILFVAAPDANIGRGLGAKGEFKVYPFIPKTMMRVSIQIRTYNITGNLFRTKNQNMLDVLNDGMFFLPLTDVTITQDCRVCGERPFVAVNKARINECREQCTFAPVEMATA